SAGGPTTRDPLPNSLSSSYVPPFIAAVSDRTGKGQEDILSVNALDDSYGPRASLWIPSRKGKSWCPTFVRMRWLGDRAAAYGRVPWAGAHTGRRRGAVG